MVDGSDKGHRYIRWRMGLLQGRGFDKVTGL